MAIGICVITKSEGGKCDWRPCNYHEYQLITLNVSQSFWFYLNNNGDIWFSGPGKPDTLLEAFLRKAEYQLCCSNTPPPPVNTSQGSVTPPLLETRLRALTRLLLSLCLRAPTHLLLMSTNLRALTRLLMPRKYPHGSHTNLSMGQAKLLLSHTVSPR